MTAHTPLAAALLLLYLSTASAGEPMDVHTRPMPSMEPLTHELVRGQSTRADVKRLLGTKTGNGGSALPPDGIARDVWFYQAVAIKGYAAVPAAPNQLHGEGYISVDMTQQILLVFFKGDLYDGFMWYSNAGTVEGKTH